MIETMKMNIEGIECEAITIPTQHSKIILVKGKNGFVGCGYFNIDAANKFGDTVAIVSGVSSVDELLNFHVTKASDKARSLGIDEKMTGKNAIVKIG